MKQENFRGIAMHPAHVSPDKATMVGVWFRGEITPRQRELLMTLNASSAPGHIGVRADYTSSAVTYLGRIKDKEAARRMAAFLAESVAVVTGVRSIIRQLPDYRAISRALATQ